MFCRIKPLLLSLPRPAIHKCIFFFHCELPKKNGRRGNTIYNERYDMIKKGCLRKCHLAAIFHRTLTTDSTSASFFKVYLDKIRQLIAMKQVVVVVHVQCLLEFVPSPGGGREGLGAGRESGEGGENAPRGVRKICETLIRGRFDFMQFCFAIFGHGRHRRLRLT